MVVGTIPAVGEHEIREWVGETSFQRGRPYAGRGAIHGVRRQGMTLAARCQGSRAAAYRVEVTFDAAGITGADCSCPVGGGGSCKHVAALLLVWAADPEQFTEAQDVDASLRDRSKEELIALIKQMLRRQPDLESVLDLPLPVPGAGRVAAGVETYRRQADLTFQRAGSEWGVEGEIADELSAMVEMGNDFLEQGVIATAAAVYEGVSAAVLDQAGMYSDEGGELRGVVGDCVEGLGACLGALTDAVGREAVLGAMFAVYRTDVEQGGAGWDSGVVDLLMGQATDVERHTIADWVRAAIPAPTEWNQWSRAELGAFLLDLESDTLDDETFLQICRDTGRVHDLVERLLALGRMDEVLEAARRVGDYDLLGVADIMVSRGAGDQATRLMLERSATSQDTRILAWLKDRLVTTGDTTAAIEAAERLFRMQPSLPVYRQLRELATARGGWEPLRVELLGFLRSTGNAYVLVLLYLDEGEIDAALDIVRPAAPGVTLGYGGYAYGSSMALTVAAAEETRPRAALELYQQAVEGRIAVRGRENYVAACELLMQVRRLYERLGEREAWDDYVSELRAENRTLRALRAELDAAGL